MQRHSKDSTEASEIWVSLKYERLSNFCYDSGQIGHDHNSCKFVTSEIGRLVGYGPDLRTGVARNIGLPVEFYRRRINEMEEWLNPLLQRQSTPTPECGGCYDREPGDKLG
ncbi:hypothetical protein ACSBR2_036408 [Camellia fascicularis]